MAMRSGFPGTSLHGSKPLAIAVLALATLAAASMLISLFATVAAVDVAKGSCEVINDANPQLADRCSLSGFERHSVAFLLLALLALALAYGVAWGRSRPAAFGLVAVGGIAVLLALLVDLPVTDDTGAIGRDFEGATASAGAGLWIELLGGALALAAGGLALLATRAQSEREPQRARQRAAEAGDAARRAQPPQRRQRPDAEAASRQARTQPPPAQEVGEDSDAADRSRAEREQAARERAARRRASPAED